MGAALVSLRGAVSGLVASFAETVFGNDDVPAVEEETLESSMEMGLLGKSKEESAVMPMDIDDIGNVLGLEEDWSDLIPVSDPVRYYNPHTTSELYGFPESRMTRMIHPVTRQRSVHLKIDYPFLDTNLFFNEEVNGEEIWVPVPAPYAEVKLHIFEECQYITVHAPNYLSIGFKVANVQIVKMNPAWLADQKFFRLDVYFKRPVDAALDMDPPFIRALHQQPPP